MSAEAVGRREQDHGASYLPGSASLKDDLQAIHAQVKQLAQVNWSMLANQEATIKHLTALATTTDLLKSTVEAAEELLQAQDEVLTARQDHFDKIVKIIYKANGYNEVGIEMPEAVKRFERWTKTISGAFWGMVITSIFSGIFYVFTQSQEASAGKKTKALVEFIERAEAATKAQEAANKEMARLLDAKKKR